MLKVLKVNFAEGNQSLDVLDDLEVVGSLFADLNGVVLLVRTTGLPSNAPIAPIDVAPSTVTHAESETLPEETAVS